ncbi:MAG: hypothetical protein DRO73_06865 [Candidatus Thorarchaeota archaeon]|nr:MAG: hypothetical protein DRO73_06865 [Candidatus Thorarchaeota archaeon]
MKLSKTDAYDMLTGVGILGTGGGGDPVGFGRPMVDWDYDRGRVYEITDPDEIDDDAFIICGGYMGSVKAFENIGDMLETWEKRYELYEAMRITEKITGKKVDHLVPFELGGTNTTVMLSLAARAGITTVDGDGLGRSAPETQMISFVGYGIELCPMPVVTKGGSVVVVEKTSSPALADEIGRFAVVNDGGAGANNHYYQTGAQLKRAVIPRSISKSIELGRAIRDANESGASPVDAFLDVMKGKLLATGSIVDIKGEDRAGHWHVVVTIESQDVSGKLEIVVKNEYMMLLCDSRPVVMFPDLVCLLDPKTGHGLMSASLKEGMPVAVAAVAAHERLRYAASTEVGKKAFSPARYGHPELEYLPMEEILGNLH